MPTRVSDRPVEGRPQPQVTTGLRALEDFRREQGVALELTPRQLEILKTLDELKAQAYLGLAAAGVGLVPADGSSARAYRRAARRRRPGLGRRELRRPRTGRDGDGFA